MSLLLLFIVVLGCLLRAYDFTGTILNHHFLRQVDTDAMARNYVWEGMNIFLPRVDWRGAGSGITEAEFPIFTYMVAILYYVFGEHVWLPRTLNLIFYALTALTLFNLVKRLFDVRVAILSVFFYSVAPLPVYFAHSLQPDTMMMLGLTAGLYYFIKWCDQGKGWDLMISAVALGIALTVKPLNAYMAFPLGYLCYQRFSWRMFTRWELWLFGAAITVPIFGWFFYSYSLWIEHGNTLYRGYANLTLSWLYDGSYPAPFFSLSRESYASELAWRVIYMIATPGGLLFLVVGAWAIVRERNYLLLWWFAGFALTMFVFAYQQRAHDYYQLPFALMFAIAMAKGCMDMLTQGRNPRILAALALAVYVATAFIWFWPRSANNNWSIWWFVLCLAGGALMLAATVLRSTRVSLIAASLLICVAYGGWQMASLTREDPTNLNRAAFAERVKALTKPGELGIIAHNWRREGWFQHVELEDGKFLSYDPVEFYLSNRKGWSVQGDQVPPAYLEVLRERGAKFFASMCCVWSDKSVMEAYPDLAAYLNCAHTPVEITPRWVIYRLNTPRRRADGSSCLVETKTP